MPSDKNKAMDDIKEKTGCDEVLISNSWGHTSFYIGFNDINKDPDYKIKKDFECGFYMILNVGIDKTTNVGIDMTTNVGIYMTTNVGIYTTTNVQPKRLNVRPKFPNVPFSQDIYMYIYFFLKNYGGELSHPYFFFKTSVILCG